MWRSMSICLVLGVILGVVQPLAAQEGNDRLDVLAGGVMRPGFEWPSDAFAQTAWAATRELFMFPFRLADLLFFPPSYYRDYGTGDFWSAGRKRPLVSPELRPLPAMSRRLKDSEQPRLLPDMLRPEAR